MRPDPQAAVWNRRKSAALVALFGISLVYGIAAAQIRLLPAASARLGDVFWGASVLVMFIAGFAWLHYDGFERNYVRTPLLNAGIVLLAIVFVPVYFWKSRPPGRRALPIFAFFGVVVGSMFLSMTGSACMFALHGSLPSG